MLVRFKGFIGPTYNLKSVNVECQRCINLYPEMDELGTEKDQEVAALIGTPGLKALFALPGTGPNRAVYLATNGVVYFVKGNKIWVMDATLVPTLLPSSTLLTAAGPVSIVDNGASIYVVDNPNAYVGVTLATAPTAAIQLNSAHISISSDPNIKPTSQVTLLDGFFCFNFLGTNQFYCSLYQDYVINPLGFAFKESPDQCIGIIANLRNLWLFGTKTTEVWFNAGLSPGVPFQPVQGSYMEIGTAAPFSIAKLGNTILWISSDPRGDGIVYMANGFAPQRVSNHAVELAIQSYGDISLAVAWTYEQNGHLFYAVNFPSADTTWVFDIITGLWHERAYLSNGDLQRHRVQTHTFAFGKHIVGDYVNGNVYHMSEDYYDDDGAIQKAVRASPHISEEMLRVMHSKFQLDFQPGVGTSGTGQGVDPQVMLQWSDDGGHTWSNEQWAYLGKIGDTLDRAIWRRLGYSRTRVYRVSITDPVERILIGAELDLTVGAS